MHLIFFNITFLLVWIVEEWWCLLTVLVQSDWSGVMYLNNMKYNFFHILWNKSIWSFNFYWYPFISTFAILSFIFLGICLPIFLANNFGKYLGQFFFDYFLVQLSGWFLDNFLTCFVVMTILKLFQFSELLDQSTFDLLWLYIHNQPL